MEYNNIIIDSSVWLAFFNKKDTCHNKALSYTSLIFQEQTMPDIVFYESITVLKNKLKQDPLLDQFIRYATESAQLTIRLFYEYNREVLKLFNSPVAEGLSYVDSLLLYLSRDYHILTFDESLKARIKKYGGLLVK